MHLMTDQIFNVVGQSVPRRDGLGHVTGKTVYVDDMQFPDMLHLKMVRSPVHHARIRGIDFSEAAKVPGFVRALTCKDVPKNIYTILCLIGVGPDEEPVLAEDRVMYKGEQIAAIVAETEQAAMEAVARVKLDLEELPAVFDVEEALKPGAPILKPWGTNYFVYEGHHCRRIRLGDVAKGFAAADKIVEGCYEPGTVGRGFGGKVDVIVEPIATLAAMKTGRPVKFKFTREEEMRVSSTRSGWRMYFKDGVTRDGRIVARQVTTYADAGAYNRHTPYAVTKHAANVAGPYAIPNVSVDVHCVYTNRQPGSAMRGFGVTSGSFAWESQMDMIADAVGADPWEIRLLNAYRNGDLRPYQKVVKDATLVEVIQAAAKLTGKALPEKYLAMNSWDREG
jgi:CO/xanthine dehydrogenase Mo-binding subunit